MIGHFTLPATVLFNSLNDLSVSLPLAPQNPLCEDLCKRRPVHMSLALESIGDVFVPSEMIYQPFHKFFFSDEKDPGTARYLCNPQKSA